MYKMELIGVDIGTGSVKAIRMTAQGQIVQQAQVAYPTLTPAPDVQEQAPEVVWQAFVKVLQRISATTGGAPAAVALSSAMHSLIPVDERGIPLMNMMIWADNRSAAIADTLKNSPLGQALYRATGTPIHPMSPLTKVRWLSQQMPDLIKRTAKFIGIKEYIWHKLFGVFEVDHAIASATGFFDIIQRSWHPPALDFAGITADQLSKPVPTSWMRQGTLPDIPGLLPLFSNCAWIIGASDGCLANVGSFATRPGVAAVTIGTSGAIRVANTSPSPDDQRMPFNYILDDQLYITGGPINNGGIVLKWFAENILREPLQEAADYQRLLAPIAQVPPGSEGLTFLPYLLGERAPIWNSDACGVFFGLQSHHRPAQLTRAVVEGISMALYQIAAGIEAQGLTMTAVHASGGFIHSPEWLQVLADILGKPVYLFHTEDASAAGACYLAMKTLGMIEHYDALQTPAQKEFLPHPASHIYYERFQRPRVERLYTALADEMTLRAHEHQLTL